MTWKEDTEADIVQNNMDSWEDRADLEREHAAEDSGLNNTDPEDTRVDLEEATETRHLSSGVTASSSVVPELTLEGAQPQYHARPFNREARNFTASRERGDYSGARPKHRTDRQRHGSCSSGDPQSKAAWEGPRQPRGHRLAKMRAAGPRVTKVLQRKVPPTSPSLSCPQSRPVQGPQSQQRS
ncbi:hypothetical protein Q8A67_000021 [Cirrhinus molitorella]|uniref:Uncharacterized protein n=1 Tax=Cirrhinus molitorella TaxID=172907 RepID=A0AA88QBY1_9TELE|nr:hypothetical protein Q8A67_000021 [Cirrhinus molitorella]